MTREYCINLQGAPVTVSDLEQPAWRFTGATTPDADRLRVYVYGRATESTSRAAAVAFLAAAGIGFDAFASEMLRHDRERHLIAPMHGDPAGEASYVIIAVTVELRREVEELRELVNKAKARMGGALDITLRGKVDATVLHGIDSEENDVWWDSFVYAYQPAWIPDNLDPADIVELTEEFNSSCHGIRVWCDYSDAVRFTCYPKHGAENLVSSDLDGLLRVTKENHERV